MQRVGLRGEERVSIVLYRQSRSQLEQGEWGRSLEKQNDTCLSKEGALSAAESENALVLTEQNMKKGFKTAFSLWGKPQRPQSPLPGWFRQLDLGFVFLFPLSAKFSVAPNKVTCPRREMAGRHRKRARRLSSVPRQRALDTAFETDLLHVFRWPQRAYVHAVITSAWLTSSDMQVCCSNSNPSKSSMQWFTQSTQNNWL